MANKPKSQRPSDDQVRTAEALIKAGKQEAEAEIERLRAENNALGPDHEAVGALKKIRQDRSYNDLLEAVILFRVKERKSYRAVGLTWEQFCEAAGVPRTTADEVIRDIKPLMDAFSTNLVSLLGMEFNKIRYLGRAKVTNLVSFEGGELVYDGEKVPFKKENVQALIETLQEDHHKQVEELRADVKAKDRVLKGKDRHAHKLARELDRLERHASEKDLSPEEDAFLQRMESLRMQFDRFYAKNIEPEAVGELLADGSVRMRAAYLSTLDYLRKQILAAAEAGHDMYCDAAMDPGLIREPGA